MKYKDLKLPIYREFIVGWAAPLVLCLSVVTLIFTMTTNPLWIQMTSLLQSRYTYSVRVSENTGLDSYYIFSANISFSPPSVGHNINADVIMQAGNSEYSDNTSWNVSQELSVRGVAISENLADRMTLNIGDKLHSTHRVRGVVTEYIVEEIVSSVGYVTSSDFVRTDGVIIMGFDEDYIENISFETLFFTTKPLADILDYSPVDIVYRHDKICDIIWRIVPSVIVVVVLCVGALVLYSHLFIWQHKASYKRLTLLGYDKSALIKIWRRRYIVIGLKLIVLTMIICLSWAYFSSWRMFMPIISTCVQAVMLFIMLRHNEKQEKRGRLSG